MTQKSVQEIANEIIAKFNSGSGDYLSEMIAKALTAEKKKVKPIEQMALDYKKIAEEKEAKLAKAWAENDRCLAEIDRLKKALAEKEE